MLVVTGELRPASARAATCAHVRTSTARPIVAGNGGDSGLIAVSQAEAMRHGWRIASAPPGIRTPSSMPTRRKPPRSP